MSQPPAEAEEMLAQVPEPVAPAAKKPRIMVWYISEHGHFRYYRGHRTSAEHYDFARAQDGLSLVASRIIVCG